MTKLKSGIYGIFNVVNNKVYIGSTGSTMGFVKRWTVHVSELKNNKHYNYHLQHAWNKYGVNNFEFRIIEECNDEVLIAREDAWMLFYKSMNGDFGYNIESATRNINSEEHKKKISEGLKKYYSENKKPPLSEETKEKIREKRKLQVITEETNIKISEALKGKIPKNLSSLWTKEVIERRIKSRKSRPNSDKVILRLKKNWEINRGKKRTPEQIQRIKDGIARSKGVGV